MTAAAGVLTGLAKLKRQDSARSQQRPVPPTSAGLANAAPEGAPRKRKRRSDVVVVRGRLRLYSASGFFLLLGLVVLAAGIGMATLGYWPHGEKMPSSRTRSGGSKTTGTKQAAGALTRFLEQHRHSERMKMLGPFTMGIGIFIFICANAILHENRDRETKIIHMRDMYSTVIDIHRLKQREQKHHHHRNSTYSREGDLQAFGVENVARLASNSLLAFSSSRAGSGGGGSTEEEEGLLGDEELLSFAGLLAPLYKERPLRGPGVRADSLRQQWSVDGDGAGGGHHARSIVSSSISAFTLPVIKLNNCVIDEPEMEAITEEDRGGDKSLGQRFQPGSSMESLVVPVPSVAKASKPPGLHPGCWLSPGIARTNFGSNSSLHMLGSHSKSLDLERRPSMLSVHAEQRKHPSWPRLDRSNSGGKGYVRLEDREELGERASDASVAAKRDYSKREKLLMISRSHNNLSLEQAELHSSALKRGSSETRF
uniref:Transmembrane protein 200A n=1 Tax=Tetraodon nigroviridis TaxID=99883 RepID=H3D047_TETNG